MENTIQKPDKKAVGLLSLGHLITDSYGGFIAPLMPFIAAKLGISIAIASMIMSFTHLSSSILQPVFGFIADAINRRFFVIMGLLFASFFICLSGSVNNVYLLALVLFMGSMGVGFYHPQATSLAGYFSGDKINSYMGFFTSMGTVGYAIGPFVSSFLAGAFGLNSIIYAFAPGFITAFLMYKFLPKLPARQSAKKDKTFFETLKAVCSNRIVISLTVISVIKALVILSFVTYMPFLWNKMGYSIYSIGIAVGLFSAFGGIASLSGGKIADWIGEKNVIIISLFPVIFTCLGTLFFVKTNPLLSFALYALTGFLVMFSVSVNIVMAQLAMPDYKGAVSGVIGGFSWGVIGLSLTPIGFIIAKVGIIPVLAVVSCSPVIGLFALKFIKNEEYMV